MITSGRPSQRARERERERGRAAKFMCRWPQVTARILMRRCAAGAGGIIAARVIAKGCMQIAILHRPPARPTKPVCALCYQQVRMPRCSWWSWWRVANAFGELNLFAALIQFADMARVELEIAPIECVLRWNASKQIVRGRNLTNLLFFLLPCWVPAPD